MKTYKEFRQTVKTSLVNYSAMIGELSEKNQKIT